MRLTANEFQVKVVAFLRKNGYLFIENHGTTCYAPIKKSKQLYRNGYWKGMFALKKDQAGLTDIIVFVEGGRTLFIELKSDHGRSRKGQVGVQNRIQELGFKNYYSFQPKKWPDFESNYRIYKTTGAMDPLKQALDSVIIWE